MASVPRGYARPVYCVDGSRTPFLKAQGPGELSASDLAVQAIRPMLARMPFSPTDLDEVIAGCIMPSPEEVNIGRLIALRVGCGDKVPGWTVQRNCATGMQALDAACQNIASGRHDLILAGGTEAMSHAPLLFSQDMAHWLTNWVSAKRPMQRLSVLAQIRPKFFAPIIALLRGLTDPTVGLSMGQTAEILAYNFGITREEMDAFAVRSHERVVQAQEKDLFKSVATAFAPSGKFYSQDNGVRPDSSMERLAKLKPYFDKKFGMVTPGNSSQITDGAAFMVLASEDAVKRYDLPVLGEIQACQWSALNPSVMGLGPAYAMSDLMKAHDLDIDDIDYWEINEAFAAQVIACLKSWQDETFCRDELGREKAIGEISASKLNVNGGAISMGHPVGASGARIVLQLFDILRDRKAKQGIAGICIGGGQAGAMLLKSS